MSYCRFIEGDVYLYEHVGGFIQCCSCTLAAKVKTIFTSGEGIAAQLFGVKGPCETCKGAGCNDCMMHGNTDLKTREAALEHMLEHQRLGDDFPAEVLDELRAEIAEGKPLEIVNGGSPVWRLR